MVSDSSEPPVDPSWLEHVRDASHQASQDFDALVAKLGTAGLAVAVAIAGLTEAAAWGWLIGAGIFFALSLACSLLSIRLSADALRDIASERKTYKDTKGTFKFVRALNWGAFILVSVAFILLSLHLFDATTTPPV
jgi:hypothetical protein